MTQFLLENTLGLGLAVVVVAVVLGGVWRQHGTRAALRNWVIGVVAGVVLLVIQKVVVTDREAVDAVLRTLVRAVDERDPAPIVARIDERYLADGLTRAEVVPLIEAMLRRTEVERPIVRGLEIKVVDSTAFVQFSIVCRVRAGGFERPTQSNWKLDFVRRGEEWKVQAIQPTSIDGQNVSSIDELRLR